MKMGKGKKHNDPFGLPKIENSQKGPKTLRGWKRKLMTGDSRKKHPAEKLVEEAFGIKEK